MDLKEVCHTVCFKKTIIYKWVKEGMFPKPIKIGSCVRWVSSGIEEWIDKKIENSQKLMSD